MWSNGRPQTTVMDGGGQGEMLTTLSTRSGPFQPHWLSPESISSATRHPGACSGAFMCKTVERGGRDRTCLCIYGKRREPAQMIPSMKYRERRDDALLRHVGSEQEKICASLGTVCMGCSRHRIILEILDSPSQPAST